MRKITCIINPAMKHIYFVWTKCIFYKYLIVQARYPFWTHSHWSCLASFSTVFHMSESLWSAWDNLYWWIENIKWLKRLHKAHQAINMLCKYHICKMAAWYAYLPTKRFYLTINVAAQLWNWEGWITQAHPSLRFLVSLSLFLFVIVYTFNHPNEVCGKS